MGKKTYLTVNLDKEEFKFVNDLSIDMKANGGKRPLRGSIVRVIVEGLCNSTGKRLLAKRLIKGEVKSNG